MQVLAAVLAAAALAGCAAPPPEAPAPQAAVDAPYRLAGGDRLRILVFGQSDLTNTYSLDESGAVSMPLIGRVRARGLTTAELERLVAARLRQGYIRDPSVSIEVEDFRPFFILGAVGCAGRYPFVNGMTVQQAVAVGGRLRAPRDRDGRGGHAHRRRPGRNFRRAAFLSRPARRHDHGAGAAVLRRASTNRDKVREKRSVVDRWIRARPDDHVVAQETTFRLSEDTYLEPDVVVFPRAAGVRGLTAATALLVVEIANSSLRYDLGRKAALYASFGVRELWVIDAVQLTARVFRRPGASGYAEIAAHGASDRLVPAFAPQAFALRLDDLDLDQAL